jgi:hypothetical protein
MQNFHDIWDSKIYDKIRHWIIIWVIFIQSIIVHSTSSFFLPYLFSISLFSFVLSFILSFFHSFFTSIVRFIFIPSLSLYLFYSDFSFKLAYLNFRILFYICTDTFLLSLLLITLSTLTTFSFLAFLSPTNVHIDPAFALCPLHDTSEFGQGWKQPCVKLSHFVKCWESIKWWQCGHFQMTWKRSCLTTK